MINYLDKHTGESSLKVRVTIDTNMIRVCILYIGLLTMYVDAGRLILLFNTKTLIKRLCFVILSYQTNTLHFSELYSLVYLPKRLQLSNQVYIFKFLLQKQKNSNLKILYTFHVMNMKFK